MSAPRRFRVLKPGDPAPLPEDPREFYVHTPRVSLMETIRRYKGVPGCSKSNLTRRKSFENWDALRAKAEAEADQKLREKMAESRASMTARHMQTARALENMGGAIENLIGAQIKKLQVMDGDKVVGWQAVDPEDMQKIASAHRAAAASVSEAILLQRDLVGEKDDRVNDLMRSAEQLYRGAIGEIEDEVNAALDEAGISATDDEAAKGAS